MVESGSVVGEDKMALVVCEYKFTEEACEPFMVITMFPDVEFVYPLPVVKSINERYPVARPPPRSTG